MTVVIFIVVLFLLILVHEFGHFIVAKRSGIRVDEFGIGFPPKVWGKKFGETEYTLNWLPIGGFVRIWGEDPTEEHLEGPDSERSFVSKPRHIQAAVLVAGVLMNVLLAYVLYVGAFMSGVPIAIDETVLDEHPEAVIIVHDILPNSPASAVFLPGDTILGVRSDDGSLATPEELVPSHVAEFISAHEGKEVYLDIRRGDDSTTVTVTPVTGVNPDAPDLPAAGFVMSLVTVAHMSLFDAIPQAAVTTYETLGAVVAGLWDLISRAVAGTADFSQVAGPLGIVNLVGDASAQGFTTLLIFTALISLNLAVINLLPIPALDGGRLLFVIIESIIRKPIPPSVATRANQIGFMILLGLMALVTVNDVLRIL